MNRFMLILLVFAISAPCWAEIAAPPVGSRETVWSSFVARKLVESSEESSSCVLEYRLSEGSRIDIFQTSKSFLGIQNNEFKIAWEVERSYKWKEAIGQAVFYQMESNADLGGVVLLELGDNNDEVYERRCRESCKRCGLLLLIVKSDGSLSF